MTELDDETRADLPSRRRPAHGVFRTLGEPLIVFLTVCTKGRQPWLADTAVHELLRAVWDEATAWRVGTYMLMPDHVHLFATPGDIELRFDNWVRYWKADFAKRDPDRTHIWQSHHWDTRLRRSESYLNRSEYVRNNPVRKGLVKTADEWPYQGQMNVLNWY